MRGNRCSPARLALAFSAAVHLLLLLALPSFRPRADGAGKALVVARLVRLPHSAGGASVEEPEGAPRAVRSPMPGEPAEKVAESEAAAAAEPATAVAALPDADAVEKDQAALAVPTPDADPPREGTVENPSAPPPPEASSPEAAAGSGDEGAAVLAYAEPALPRAGDVAEILAEIRRRVEARKNYPPLARRRGWEGSVTVEIELDGGGDLEGVRLLRPSGYAVLDRATLAAVREAVPYPPLPGKVRIPVSYRLNRP